MNHVFFTGSGSEGNDTMLRLVRHYWACKGQPNKKIIIGRDNGYHGSTVAQLNLSMKFMRAGRSADSRYCAYPAAVLVW